MTAAAIPRQRASEEKLTLQEVLAELKITRSTFYDWRAKGRAPRCHKLPNGDLRILRSELDEWFNAQREVLA
ncbi:helix-turn-helix transcriptional regulator [Catellatospora aurea]|uniref:Helix-turn-helix transcriptional regulator n=1 Tax=Catellatospora aurea TaxID=1337874 RepID=A0ABW2H2F7_9ACTN